MTKQQILKEDELDFCDGCCDFVPEDMIAFETGSCRFCIECAMNGF